MSKCKQNGCENEAEWVVQGRVTKREMCDGCCKHVLQLADREGLILTAIKIKDNDDD